MKKENVMKQSKAFVRHLMDLQLTLYAANACYFLILAVFPGLLLVLASLRFTSLSANDLIYLLEMIVPSALMGWVERLIVSTYYNASGTLVWVTALTALWSTSRGVYALLTGLNAIYGVRENRSYLYTRLLSVVYMCLCLIAIVLSLVLHVFGQNVSAFLETMPWRLANVLGEVVDLHFVVLIVAQSLIFTLMYMVLPNRRNRFWDSLPGAVGAALGWQLFSNVFSIYVINFHEYSNIYGSLYAVALAMLWLYCCALIFLFGGAVNKFVTHWKNS